MKVVALLGISTIVLAVLSFRMIGVLDIGKQIKFSENYHHCHVLKGIVGAEDITKYSHSIVLISSDDRMKLWDRKLHDKGGPDNTKCGSIVALALDSSNVKQSSLFPLPLLDYPLGVKFHPHGLYLYNKDYLFVINHAYKHGGERIDVFFVNTDSHSSPVSLQYLYCIGREFFTTESLGVLNDIVVTEEGKFYVTQYLSFPDTPEGRADNEWIGLQHIFSVVTKRPWTHVRYCEYDVNEPEKDKSVICKIVATGMGLNGINRNVNGSLIFVADPTEKVIGAYKPLANGNLELQEYITTNHGVDNIELDQETGLLFLGTVGSCFAHLRKLIAAKGGADVSGSDFHCPGGAQILYPDSLTVKELFLQDGSLLSSISSVCKLSEYILMGSWEADGVLICPFVINNE